jgi:dihydroorotase
MATIYGREGVASRKAFVTVLIDLILKGGTVVNHDGVGVRDIAVDKGRIQAVGDVSGFKAA